MIYLVTDTFPRQQARTQRFTLGVPRSFQVSPDGGRVAFLRSRGGADPVTCLWVLDVASGEERLIADPAEISPGSEADREEKARRERSRERASGIVSFAADAGLRTVAFGLGGRVYAGGPDRRGWPRPGSRPGLAGTRGRSEAGPGRAAGRLRARRRAPGDRLGQRAGHRGRGAGTR